MSKTSSSLTVAKGVLEVCKKVLMLLILNREDEVSILLTTDFNVYVNAFINCSTVVC